MDQRIEIFINEQVFKTLEVVQRQNHETHEYLRAIIAQNGKVMALGQDILDAVTAEDTKVDSVIALLNGLVADGTITSDVKAAILAKVKGSEDKLDAAIGANTPAAPPADTTGGTASA